MGARYVVALAVSAGGLILSAILLVKGWDEDPSRYMISADLIATLSWTTLMSVWALGRVRAMVHTYQLGYRHGRRDANYRLIEDGLWLSAKAKAKADADADAERLEGDGDR